MIKQLCFIFLCVLGPLWELSCAALKLWGKSWRRNVPNTQTWILARPDFTSTRRTSEQKKKKKIKREKNRKRTFTYSKDNNQLELCLASEEKCQNIEKNQRDRMSVYRPSSIYSEGSTEACWVILISGAQGFAPFLPLWSKESLRLHIYIIYICIYLCHIRLHYCSTWLKLQGRFMLLLRWGPWFLDLLNMKVLTEREKLLLYKILTNGVYLLFIMIL